MAITGHSTREMFDRCNTLNREDTWEGIEALGVFLLTKLLAKPKKRALPKQGLEV